MELENAKNIVRQLKGKSLSEIAKENDYFNIPEAIRIVCEASTSDQESYILLNYIPFKLYYAGLYPHKMQVFDIIAEQLQNKCI